MYARAIAPNPALQLLRSSTGMCECRLRRERKPASDGEIGVSLERLQKPRSGGAFFGSVFVLAG